MNFRIGQRWTLKRGRAGMPAELVVRNIYRPDSQLLVLEYPGSVKRTVRMRDVTRNYNQTEQRTLTLL